MKIASIALKDFRAYENAQINFDEPLSVIRGANHQGKSTIAQALQLALTRRAEGTDARGVGSDDKIRSGAKKAQVDVNLETLQGPVPVAMILKHGSRNYSAPPAFENYLVGSAARWSCVLDTEFFISQKPEEQKAILASLVLPTEYEFDPAMIELTNKYLEVDDAPPVQFIDAAYSKAFAARRDAKRDADNLHVPQVPKAPEYAAAKIQEYIDKLNGELAEELRSVPEPVTVVDTAALESHLTERNEYVLSLQNERTTKLQEQKDAEAEMLTGPQMTKWKKLADGRTHYNELQKSVDKAHRQQDDLEETIENIRDLAAGEEGCCPTCLRELNPEIRDGIIFSLNNQIAGLKAQEASFSGAQSDLGDIAGAEAKLAQHEASRQAVLTAKKRVVELTETITNVGKKIVDLEKQIEDAKGQVPAEPVPAKDLSGIHAKLRDWNNRLVEAKGYETAKAQAARAEERRKQLLETVADLETLVSYFGKDGIKATLIQDNIAAFTESVNAVLSAWGYEAELSIEPYEFNVTTEEGRKLPLKELSGSEKLMFAVALQAAIAHASKIRLIVIDRADTFINGERNRLFGRVKELIDMEILDQAIVLVSDEREEVPEMAGVAFYRVGEGEVQRLGREPEEAAA